MLLSHLKSQMLDISDADKDEKLLRFLSRSSEKPLTSAISIQRWLQKTQFANSTTRRQMANALGVEVNLLEGFLMHGSPVWQEFVFLLPPLPEEYKQPWQNQVSFNTKSPSEVVVVINRLLSLLSLEWLIRVRDEASSRIEQEVRRLGIDQNFRQHPLRLLLVDSLSRSGLSQAQFIEIVANGQHQGLDSRNLVAILEGSRLPTRKELKFISLYLRNESGDFYPLEFLLNLLQAQTLHKHQALDSDGEVIDKRENCNGVNKGH